MKVEYKKCNNPECDEWFQPIKSSKRIYCSSKCRNTYNYKIRLAANNDLIQYNKKFKKLEKILTLLLDANINRLSIEDFNKSEFNTLKLSQKIVFWINGIEKIGHKVQSIVIEEIRKDKPNYIYFYKFKS
ncbi:hypothetical protein [Flavobacterium sp.]|jgi:hypothetical protein|uniref:hypothetical protein n=1 Tax=Flavobacterium sp. TaxID=239 RepID=UPI002638F3AD|nr:hypothetical protein [Flavobacterium sp.]